MFGGGGGLNPRKMQKMMEQMGIEMEDLDAERVVIDLADGDRLVFDDADVTMMEARGQQTYQVVGDPDRRGAGELGAASEPSASDGDDAEIPDDDVELVAQRTGVDEATAREALTDAGGDLAAAIHKLE